MKKLSLSAAKSKAEKIRNFDQNGPALESANVFGLPFTSEESDIILIPVPWEATVSYGGGTSKGPDAIFEASSQVDLLHPEFKDLWKVGISMEKGSNDLAKQSKSLKKNVSKIIDALEKGRDISRDAKMMAQLDAVNEGSAVMINEVYRQTSTWLKKGKLVGLVGGDHSTPLGFFKALADKYPTYGILQIDAHMDLRNSFEGFTYSHASIMYNALEISQISKLVQVGIRDFCAEENEYVKKSKSRVEVFSYAEVSKNKFEGVSWKKQCDQIIGALPQHIYISFDIDGLDPKLCPNTGTPVPGGFEFHEITYLLSELAKSKKKIISFDLNEVSPGKDDWDGNVGARMLFHLCGVLAKSNGLVK
ncbi:MAG: agmatinase family protein [Bacteroidetes bacterium]|nr:agmatinase family protein [Bacteroidota bacterium]